MQPKTRKTSPTPTPETLPTPRTPRVRSVPRSGPHDRHRRPHHAQSRFPTEGDRWDAVRLRAADADDAFVYAVRTTGVFCRPTCRSRRPLRRNVRFFDSPRDAESAGFRACRKCRPLEPPTADRHRDQVLRACRMIDRAQDPPSLRALAADAGVSPWHFQRVFKRIVGVSPKQYALTVRAKRFRTSLRRDQTVTDAIYESGHESSSRAYEHAADRLGMNPSTYRKGAPGMDIAYTIANCDLGKFLVATSDRGVCAVALGDNAQTLRRELSQEFPRAHLCEDASRVRPFVDRIARFVARPTRDLSMPLDIQGTAFQQRVWRALRDIAPGETKTYADIANEVGAPLAARAVANACAKNRLALAIPCHRVVRADAQPTGYRWGESRKRQLIEREQTQHPSPSR